MDDRNYRWSNKQIRNHVEVLDEVKSPHIILKNATYLNTYLHQCVVSNIWIYEDRIVYVGENLPENSNGYEKIRRLKVHNCRRPARREPGGINCFGG